MHGHRGFSAARHSLNEDIAKGPFPDNLILFLLDRGDDLPQHHLFIFSQILNQQLIVGSYVTVIISQQLSLLHVIRPLQLQIHIHLLIRILI